MTSSASGSVWVDDTTNVSRIFSSRLSYSKGALLLHMLRWKMGDTVFFAAVNNYFTDPDLAYAYATTSDLQQHLEAESGLNLDEFFADWFYGQGWPTYEILWSQNQDNLLTVQINQTPSNASVSFFEMPVPLVFSDGTQNDTIIFDHTFDGQIFSVPLEFEATGAAFDPERWLCAKSTVTYSAALPVELLSFEARLEGKKVLLEWSTANEINTDYFQVERSNNGLAFEIAGKVLASRISTINSVYSFTDTPGIPANGHWYYRLKSVDLDGSESFSPIKLVPFQADEPFFSIQPNPGKGVFTIKFRLEHSNQAEISIYNISGMAVFYKKFPSMKNVVSEPINLSSLSPGVYQVVMRIGSSTKLERIIVER